MSSIQSLVTLQLPLPPSCVAFVGNTNYFVVGTYYLEKPKDVNRAKTNEDDSGEVAQPQAQSRRGSLMLYRLNLEDDTM